MRAARPQTLLFPFEVAGTTTRLGRYMNLLLIPAAAFILLGIAFSTLFARRVSRDRVNRFPDESDEIFSLARYRAMDRLLS